MISNVSEEFPMFHRWWCQRLGPQRFWRKKRCRDSVTGRRGRGRGSVICVHCRGWCPAQGDEGGGSRATIVIKADRGEEDEEAFHRHSQSSSRSAEAGGSSWRRSWGWCWTGGGAASDREMSQCYELLIATHPIHILMPNPSAPIGPSSPQHGEGKDENLYFTLPKPPFPLSLQNIWY